MLAMPTRLNPEEKQMLTEQCTHLVKFVASRLLASLPRHIELSDLINDGFVGLMDALDRYDPSRGTSFQTFATTRIRGAILDSLRSQDWMSRGARRRCRELQKTEEALVSELGRSPRLLELCQHSGLSPQELRRRRHEQSCSRVTSLDDYRRGLEDSEERVSDSLADKNQDVQDEVARRFLSSSLQRGVKNLNEREQLIIALYYFEELNLREIGVRLGVSEARVCQLHARCLHKLRGSLTAMPLGLAV